MQDIEFIEGDIRSEKDVQYAVQQVDYVFHLAAQISVAESMVDPAGCFDINVTGTNNLFFAASNAGVKKVVISSSAAVYGEQETLPIQEDAPLYPLSPYASSKLMDEIMGGMYSRSFGLPVVCLRYFNVFGPRQRPDSPYAAAIPIFIRRLLEKQSPLLYGDGGQTRDFIFVSDVANANILAAEKGPDAGGVMNICTGTQISILELLKILQSLIPESGEIEYRAARPGDIYHSCGSRQKAAEVIGFHPEVTFVDGLRRTIEWMKK